MKRDIILKLALFFLIGVIFGILFYQWVVPELEGFFYSKLAPQPVSSVYLKKLAETQPRDCKKAEKRGKVVEIDLSNQKMRMCKDGKVIEEFSISSGKKGNSTPFGSFRVIHKSLMIYSKIAECWLPFWVGFEGNYGFHEVPICDNKGKRVGQEQIGQPISLGCIRLKVGEAEKFYNWAEIGIEVDIYE